MLLTGVNFHTYGIKQCCLCLWRCRATLVNDVIACAFSVYYVKSRHVNSVCQKPSFCFVVDITGN